MSRLRALFITALLLLSGCESVRYGCFNACLGAAGGYKGETRVEPPDRSTSHCDALPGKVYRAENGDELSFRSDSVEWRHAGVNETRRWQCGVSRSIQISGFVVERDGHAFLSQYEQGILFLGKTKYRIVGGGSTYVFPCELLPGRTFFAETGDKLAFAAAGKTVVWTSSGQAETLVWTCADRDLAFRKGAVDTAVPYAPGGAAVSGQPPLPSFVRWNGIRYDWGADGKRPMFPCDRLAGRDFRRADSGDVLSFGAKTAEWRRADRGRTLQWTCFDQKITFRDGAATSEGFVTAAADRVCYQSYCFEQVTLPGDAPRLDR